MKQTPNKRASGKDGIPCLLLYELAPACLSTRFGSLIHMTANKFEQLFLRQYRELHESKSRKGVILGRMLRSFLGAVVICVVMGGFLYFTDTGAFHLFIPLGVGLVLGNSATQLGDLLRRMKAWDTIEEITDWPKVYELLGDKDGQLR